jgi:hypothetical protein
MWLPFSVLYVGMTLLFFLLSTDCWLVKLSNVTDLLAGDSARGHVTGVGVATSGEHMASILSILRGNDITWSYSFTRIACLLSFPT